MLSDRERETLRELQRQFTAEDPDLVRDFDDVGRRGTTYSLQWVFARPRWVYTTAIVVAVALGVLMLLAAAPGTALLFAALATMVAMARKRRDELHPRETGDGWSRP